MANRYKGEVPLPTFAETLGEGVFLRFELDDLAELEDVFGPEFFNVVEGAAHRASARDLPKCLTVGLKKRAPDGTIVRIWPDIDKVKLLEAGFRLADIGMPILEALSQAHLQKGYEELLKEAEEARRKLLEDTVKQAKEAAEKQGVPFDAEASLNLLLKLLTGQESPPSTSGDSPPPKSSGSPKRAPKK